MRRILRNLAADRRRLAIAAAAGLTLLLAGVLAEVVGGPRFSPSRQVTLEGLTPDTGLAGVDADGDDLSDLEEIFQYGTSPERPDSDADGIPDAWEARHRRFDPVSNLFRPAPNVADSGDDLDGDGLTNLDEFRKGTDPWERDSDGDGMDDGYEVRSLLDPLKPDAAQDNDEDGLTNLQESRLRTNASSHDTDSDGLTDLEEIERHGTSPVLHSSAGSGIADGWLVAFALDPLVITPAFEDPDGDGFTTLEEFSYSATRLSFSTADNRRQRFLEGLDPLARDTDGDGLADGWEVESGLDPLSPDDALADPDGDGLTNLEEFLAGADPFSADTDGDGMSDLDEVKTGWVVKIEEIEARVFPSPAARDTDGDGLSDLEERDGRTVRDGIPYTFPPLDPQRPDSDLDGLDDLFEVTYDIAPRLDPRKADTDGDTMTDKAEFDLWTLRMGEASLELLDRVRSQRCAGNASLCGEADDAVRASLGPKGDLNGNGVPNVVDPDSDSDGALDGEELFPPRKAAGPGREDKQRLPRTDPVLSDTDGDGLADGWENQFALWDDFDRKINTWNLNASNKDSLGLADGLTDADRDLDGDGVDYVSPPFVFTNLEEFKAGTDPNLRDSDGDGISDGWEAFFAAFGLSPLDGEDAGKDFTEVPVTRFVRPPVDSGSPPDAACAAAGGAPAASVCVLPTAAGNLSAVLADATTASAGGDLFRGVSVVEDGVGVNRLVLRFRGAFNVTFLHAFRNRLDLRSPDAMGGVSDGLPDVWQVYHLTLRPGSDLAPGSDPDGDDLTNREECSPDAGVRSCLRGTDPLPPTGDDTDRGGMLDSDEVNLQAGGSSIDPLFPLDDAPNEDLDKDGLTNAREAQGFTPSGSACLTTDAVCYRTNLADFDTDNDALLDGQDRCTAAAGLIADYLARLIAHNRTGSQECAGSAEWRFYGELGKGANPRRPDTDGDGMPDGWEAQYGLSAAVASINAKPSYGDEANNPDFLDNLQEYSLGIPDGWSLASDGVWWLGSDPTRRDTDGDGIDDGLVDPQSGAIGNDHDYDNDGLNDFTGEDACPFLYPADDCLEAPHDVRAGGPVRALLAARLTWSDRDSDGDGTKNRDDRAGVRLTGLALDSPLGAGFLGKGVPFNLSGRVTLNASGQPQHGDGVPGVPVFAALACVEVQSSGEVSCQQPLASRILGIGVSGADGRFTIPAEINASRSAALESLRGNTSVLGELRAPGSVVPWSFNTTAVTVGGPVTLHVFTYAMPVSAGYAHTVPWGSAEGLRAASTNASTAFGVIVKSATRVRLPEFHVENNATLAGTGTLLDAVGDAVQPLPSMPLVRLSWQEQTFDARVESQGRFSIDIPVGNLSRAGFYPLNASFPGTALLERGNVSMPAEVLFATRLEASIVSANRTVVAGKQLEIRGKLRDVYGDPVAGAAVGVDFLSTGSNALTDPEGAFDLRAEVPIAASVGTQRVIVTFPGGNSHSASSVDAGFVVVRQAARLVLAPHSGSISAPVTLEGRLLDLAGRVARDPTGAASVQILAFGRDATSPVDNRSGVFRLEIPAEHVPGVGNHSASVVFAGSPFYLGVTERTHVLLHSPTRLDAPALRLSRNGTVFLEGKLLDARGQGLPSQDVNVTFQGAAHGVTTNASGAWRVEILLRANETLGPADSLVTYNGSSNGLLLPSADARPRHQIVSRTKLELPDVSANLGTLSIPGRIRTDEDVPIEGARISLRADGKPAGVAIADRNGRFTLLFESDTPRTPRLYRVTALYQGVADHGDARAEGNYSARAATRIEPLEVPELVRGQPIRASIRLVDENGNPGARLPVRLEIVVGIGPQAPSGRAVRPVAESLTDGGGVVNLSGTVSPAEVTGPALLRFRSDGDSTRGPSVLDIPGPIAKRAVLVVSLPDSVSVGEPFQGTLTLKDDAGVPLAGKEVLVRFTGYAYPFRLSTDASGKAAFPARISAEGAVLLDARFPGEGNLTSSQAVATVLATTPVFLTAGFAAGAVAAVAAVAVLLAGGAVALRRRTVREAEAIIRRAEEALLAGSEYAASIFALYRSLVAHLERYGYIPTPDVTAREFAAAIGAALTIRRDNLDRLVELFEEARYSRHDVGERERQEALRRLRAVLADLAQAPGRRA